MPWTHAAETAAARAAEREEASRNREPGVRSFVGDRCAERGPKTEVLGDGRSAPRPFGSCDGLVPRVHAAPQVTTLPPIELDDSPTVVHPTVFIGVGRSAGRILLQLRRRFADRFGRLDDIPAFQMLMLDTDTKDLADADPAPKRIQVARTGGHSPPSPAGLSERFGDAVAVDQSSLVVQHSQVAQDRRAAAARPTRLRRSRPGDRPAYSRRDHDGDVAGVSDALPREHRAAAPRPRCPRRAGLIDLGRNG